MKNQRIQFGPSDEEYFVLPEEDVIGVYKVHNHLLIQCAGGHNYFAMFDRASMPPRVIPIVEKAQDVTGAYLIKD